MNQQNRPSCGQSCKNSVIVNYRSRLAMTRKLPRVRPQSHKLRLQIGHWLLHLIDQSGSIWRQTDSKSTKYYINVFPLTTSIKATVSLFGFAICYLFQTTIHACDIVELQDRSPMRFRSNMFFMNASVGSHFVHIKRHEVN